MTKKESEELLVGLYRLFWKSGGSSLASVGQNRDGGMWFAACNWTSGSSTNWRDVERVEMLYKHIPEPLKKQEWPKGWLQKQLKATEAQMDNLPKWLRLPLK